jgi:hypothetical protein
MPVCGICLLLCYLLIKKVNIMSQNLSEAIKGLHENSRLSVEKRFAYQQYLLIPASTLLGILISLHGSNLNTLYTRLFFSLAIVALVCGILTNALSLYGHVDAVNRAQKAGIQEVSSALREHREVNYVSAPERRVFVACERIAYTSYALSLVFLSLYTVFMVWT